MAMILLGGDKILSIIKVHGAHYRFIADFTLNDGTQRTRGDFSQISDTLLP